MRKICLATLILLIFSAALVAQPQPVGEIVDLKGEVFINHQPAKIGMELYDKDTIGTQEGEVEIVFKEARIYLSEYTQVRIVNLYPLEIEVWYGEILGSFLKPTLISTPHRRFSLEGTWKIEVTRYQTNTYNLEETLAKEDSHYYYYYYYYPLVISWWHPWIRIGWWWTGYYWYYWHPYCYYRYRYYFYSYYGYSYPRPVSRNQLRQRRYYRVISKDQLKRSSYYRLRTRTSKKRSLSNSTFRTLIARLNSSRSRIRSFRKSLHSLDLKTRSYFRTKERFSRSSFRSSSFKSSRSYFGFRIKRTSSRSSFRSSNFRSYSHSSFRSSSRSRSSIRIRRK